MQPKSFSKVRFTQPGMVRKNNEGTQMLGVKPIRTSVYFTTYMFFFLSTIFLEVAASIILYLPNRKKLVTLAACEERSACAPLR